MDFVFKLVALVISFSLVQSRETIKISKSIKLNEKMIYDCVEIHKQPSLNHPLLKNHKIEMEPSFASIPISKYQVERKKHEKNIIECPNGTVPILRNTEEFVTNAQSFFEKHINPLTVESHGIHFAGVRLDGQGQNPYKGMASYISVHDLKIGKDQVSYGHLYVGTRVNHKDNFIQAGWTINEKLYGDGRTWSYGVWKGANGAGCYNTICPGFVQVSKTDPLAGPLAPAPPAYRYLGLTFQQSKKTGNWWITDIVDDGRDIGIGYWPKELFDLMSNGANMMGVGGAVESSPSGISPPMGNGHFPTGNDMDSARVTDIRTYNPSKHSFDHVDISKLVILQDSKKCYGIQKGKHNIFLFGGPGGYSCGI